MNLPAVLFVTRWLIRDTMRQARARGIFWLLLGITFICTLFCLTLGIRGDKPTAPLRPWEDPAYLPRAEVGKHSPEELTGIDVPSGELTLLFGAFRVPLARSRVEAVRSIEFLLAGGLADTAGVLLALIWTAGFLPSLLDPATASLLLAKPAPRWLVLAGKITGVLAFVALQATAFVGLTWLALGIRTGVWELRYFLGVPWLLVHFAIFYCVSAFLGVLTRSTVAAVLGTLAFWFVCWGVNYVRLDAVAAGHVAPVLEFAYWILPKPVDLGLLLMEALDAPGLFGSDSTMELMRSRGVLAPESALLSSLALPLVAFLAAVRRLARAEF